MNFDDDEDLDFSFNPKSTNKLASLFKASSEENSDETLKYKASKQPTQTQASQVNQQQASSVIFFSTVQAFKFINNQYSPQGKLGMAILSNPANTQAAYRIILYMTKTNPLASIKITNDFKISLQKSNYVSFYDESRQIWSVLFESDDLVSNFAKQITLCKCNLLNGNIQNDKLVQDLKFNDSDSEPIVENNDSIEVSTLVSSWQNFKLTEIENTIQKPFKLKLGKNKLPPIIETLVVKMRQGDRRLFCINGSLFKSIYPNCSNTPIFYDIHIIRVKKNKEENSNILDQMPPMPSLEAESRSRSESIKEKSKIINDQINDPKFEKAKVISRMAKLGQQMIPGTQNQEQNQSHDQLSDKWENSKNSDSNLTTDKTIYQEGLINQSEEENMSQEVQAAKQAILLQKTLQQQLLQNQIAQVQTQQNQLALFNNPLNNPLNNSTLFNLIEPNAQVNMMNQSLQQNAQTSQQNSSVIAKLDLINEKLEHIKQLSQQNKSNMPNMETQVVLHNIQRIVKENEQYKQELFEKSAKIEEQNTKITDLLLKAQNYVEQSHQYLELKNSSLQNSSEKNQNKILELEQDKMRLTSELTKLTSQISELNLEINKIRKEDFELKQQLNDVSKNTDQYKQNYDRILLENADLQTKLDTLVSELKKERQLRKTHETKNELNEEEISELKSSLTQIQKLLDEKKKKLESDRMLFDQEMEEIKKSHSVEINQYKDKLLKARNNLNDLQKEQIKQVEEDLNREWEAKMDKIIQQNETKFNRKLSDLSDENNLLKKQLNEANDLIKTTRNQSSSKESETDKLRQENEDLKAFKERFERLQSQAVVMKERYETRIKELLEAEPESEVVAEEVKKLMNKMYKIIKIQIKPEQYYSGNGILIAMLKIIKMVTLQLLDSKTDNQFDDENDFFSQFIFVPELVNINKETVKEIEKPKQEEQTENDTNESLPRETQKNDPTSISKPTEDIENNEKDERFKLGETETNLGLSNQMEIQPTETNETTLVSDKLKSDIEENVEKNDSLEPENKSLTNEEGKITEINDQEVINTEFEDQEQKINEMDKDEVKITEIDDQEQIIKELDYEEHKITDNGKIEEITDNSISEQEQNVTDARNKNFSSKLFDESDEDDKHDEILFSSKSSETKILENSGMLPQVEKVQDLNKNETSSKNLVATPANLKFSPPPLFDDDDDNNSEKDIDWFK